MAAESSRPSASATAGPEPSTSSDAFTGRVDVGGTGVMLACRGSGSPTVVFEAGLGSGGTTWAPLVDALAPTTRTCRYDRPGVGASDPVAGVDALSVGDRVDELRGLLEAAGIDGPYVLAGHSYGGMIARLFAARYPADTAGLVLVDASHEEQFRPGSWWDDGNTWRDARHGVDEEASRSELLAATDLGDVPLVVLTNGRMTGDVEREWSTLQDALGAMSTDSLHMVAADAGHGIQDDAPDLVSEAVLATVDAARSGADLPACGPRFEAVGAECLAGTMQELIAAWDAERATFEPAAGDLPTGSYTFEDGDVAVTAVVRDGGLAVELRHLDGTVERFQAEYAAKGDRVVLRWPFDWRMPRTPGLNTARWTVVGDGSLRFEQLDQAPPEPWLAAVWAPVGE
jgi:pimeloyl-ACP methyl ester carboxylesterase